MKRQLLTIKVYLILRLVITTADVDLGHTFHLQQFTFQAGGNAVGFFHAVTVHFKIGRCLGRHTRIATSENDLCLTEFRIGLQVFAHFITDSFQRNITLIRVYQADVEGDDVRTVVLHGCPGIIRVGLSHRIVTYLHNTFILLKPLSGQLLRYLLRHFLTGSDRQFQLHSDTGVILRREELRTDGLCTKQTQNKEYHATCKNHHAVTDCPVEHTRIPVVQSVQCMFYRAEEYPEHLRLLALQTEQLRTKHRRQRQSGDSGYKHNGTHHPAQLLEQYTGHTGHHRQREEYGNHRQCRSHNGDSHLVRAMHRRLLRVGTALDVCRDILQYHNGIVHHHTDSNGKR